MDVEADAFDNVRVVDEPTAIEICNSSPRTWKRMKARGETPPMTKISDNRVGYRIVHLKAWLDARQVRRDHDQDRCARLLKNLRREVSAT